MKVWDLPGRARLAPKSRQLIQPANWLTGLISPMALPIVAALTTLVVYLLRAVFTPWAFQASESAYFNYLADAFLHGQLHLRLEPASQIDLIFFQDRVYLYWPPFPSLVVMPFVALFGVGISDTLYTAVMAGLTIALAARLLSQLDRLGIAPLSPERRAILVTTLAFGTVIPILASRGMVWMTAQIIGWGCVLCAAVCALGMPNRWGYLLTGVALACATTTRMGLLFNGLWLAYVLLMRDRHWPITKRLHACFLGSLPIVVGVGLLGWYNAARFGSPLDTGLAWHNMSDMFREDFARYGVFNLHYLPTNFYHHFLAHPFTLSQKGVGGGIFWMTPLFLAALYAVWRERRSPLTWVLVASCALIYVPIGLVMGTGYVFGPRYLLDLFVPLVVLTAQGMRTWRRERLQVLMVVSVVVHLLGAGLLIWFDRVA